MNIAFVLTEITSMISIINKRRLVHGEHHGESLSFDTFFSAAATGFDESGAKGINLAG